MNTPKVQCKEIWEIDDNLKTLCHLSKTYALEGRLIYDELDEFLCVCNCCLALWKIEEQKDLEEKRAERKRLEEWLEREIFCGPPNSSLEN